MPPKNQDAAQSDANVKSAEKEMVWSGCSLGSVPINIIQYCLWKSNQQQTSSSAKTPARIPKNVVVHLSKGNYRYRTENLTSIDSSMNMRLQNVTVSRVKREKVQQRQQQNNFLVTSRNISSNKAPSTNNANVVNNNNSIPQNEELVGMKKDILLPGSSVVMMELPREWGDLFDAQAKEVNREYFKRYRERKAMYREQKKAKTQLLDQKKKEKKEARAKKEQLLKKGAKKAGKKQ